MPFNMSRFLSSNGQVLKIMYIFILMSYDHVGVCVHQTANDTGTTPSIAKKMSIPLISSSVNAPTCSDEQDNEGLGIIIILPQSV